MSFKNRKMLLKAFVKSQFGYCPLTWLFHGRNANSQINDIRLFIYLFSTYLALPIKLYFDIWN